ncbi:helix-turn-helix domain-containing protein [Desulfobacter sp.]|uniref:helix-turn-helix domain-containing protein n=1 Tax=Desulfobacter sp. TaxID=2294 RepID=UPI003D0ECABB
MMGKTNKNWVAMSDKAIISAIGAYIRHQRLEQNKTQAQIAEDAGINRWTVSQIENGGSITLATLIQILRVLDLLNLLSRFTIEESISPIEYARLKEKEKKRARPKPKANDSNGDLGW